MTFNPRNPQGTWVPILVDSEAQGGFLWEKLTRGEVRGCRCFPGPSERPRAAGRAVGFCRGLRVDEPQERHAAGAVAPVPLDHGGGLRWILGEGGLEVGEGSWAHGGGDCGGG